MAIYIPALPTTTLESLVQGTDTLQLPSPVRELLRNAHAVLRQDFPQLQNARYVPSADLPENFFLCWELPNYSTRMEDIGYDSAWGFFYFWEKEHEAGVSLGRYSLQQMQRYVQRKFQKSWEEYQKMLKEEAPLQSLPQLCAATGISGDYCNLFSSVIALYELGGRDLKQLREKLQQHKSSLQRYEERFPSEQFAYAHTPEQQWRVEGLNLLVEYLRAFAEEKAEMTNEGFEQAMCLSMFLIYDANDRLYFGRTQPKIGVHTK